MVVRNLTNSAGSAATPDAHGSFTVVIPLDPGTNDLLITATDRAANQASTARTVVPTTKATH